MAYRPEWVRHAEWGDAKEPIGLEAEYHTYLRATNAGGSREIYASCVKFL